MAYSGPWRTVNSLTTLQAQLDKAFPGRSHASDGFIADDSHSTSSDHYPHKYPALGAVPVVTAFDGTHDPAHGCDNRSVCEAIRVSRDPRVKYVISNGELFSSYDTSTRKAWAWGKYTGSSDPHRTHFHVSVVATAIADSTRPWSIGGLDMADLNTIQATVDRIEQGTIVPSNALIYWLRAVVEGRASLASGGPGQGIDRDGIPELMAAINAIALADAQAVADAPAANDVWTAKLADGIAAAVGAKLGDVLIDVLNTTKIEGKLVTPEA